MKGGRPGGLRGRRQHPPRVLQAREGLGLQQIHGTGPRRELVLGPPPAWCLGQLCEAEGSFERPRAAFERPRAALGRGQRGAAAWPLRNVRGLWRPRAALSQAALRLALHATRDTTSSETYCGSRTPDAVRGNTTPVASAAPPGSRALDGRRIRRRIGVRLERADQKPGVPGEWRFWKHLPPIDARAAPFAPVFARSGPAAPGALRPSQDGCRRSEVKVPAFVGSTAFGSLRVLLGLVSPRLVLSLSALRQRPATRRGSPCALQQPVIRKSPVSWSKDRKPARATSRLAAVDFLCLSRFYQRAPLVSQFLHVRARRPPVERPFVDFTQGANCRIATRARRRVGTIEIMGVVEYGVSKTHIRYADRSLPLKTIMWRHGAGSPVNSGGPSRTSRRRVSAHSRASRARRGKRTPHGSRCHRRTRPAASDI